VAQVRGPVGHWDDARTRVVDEGYLKATWRNFGGVVGTVTFGLKRLVLDPGCMPTPPHVHGAEEEIFYVLGGSGLSWQGGETCEVRAGDCIAHVAGTRPHTLRAGDEGLDVLVYGERAPVELCNLPRGERGFLGTRWVSTAGPSPWNADFEHGPPDFPPPGERLPTIVNLADVEAHEDGHERVGASIRDLGRAAGSVTSGLRHSEVAPGKLNAVQHCHSAEEELFVVMAGSGTLLLGDERIPVREGNLVSRPAGTGVAHAFHAGDEGLELLIYGTRDPNDMCYYPRSGKIAFRGLGVIARIDEVSYWDGER
jgi:uncharacterized cupin superfamily protein